ncbi:hypothetical protein F5Y08DRAFT_93942 [Xylaria arbuscula]|nr:hypothetical protein F5Y08DRAFT_93942 [Xylaria arbuscula]
MRWQEPFKKTLCTAAVAMMVAMNNAGSAAAFGLRVITSNIRYAADASTYEQPWSVRGPLLIETISATAANTTTSSSIPIIGMQEVLHEQLVDILDGFNNNNAGEGEEEWAYLGTGRDDGVEAGEYCPLFYQPSRLNLVFSTQKWLSPTPDVPSYWPGAGSRRYVIVAVFEDRGGSGTRFVAANTHLDNASSEARSEGVKIVLEVIRDVQAVYGGGGDGNLPVTLSGDFNSRPGADAYSVLVEDGYLGESYVLAGEDGGEVLGPYETYTGFNPDEVDDVKQRIDFVWVGPQDGDDAEGNVWDVERYEVVDNVVDGVYFSDHRPVVVDVTLKA